MVCQFLVQLLHTLHWVYRTTFQFIKFPSSFLCMSDACAAVQGVQIKLARECEYLCNYCILL